MFRFRLQSLLALVTLLCCEMALVAWVYRSITWIEARHRWIDFSGVMPFTVPVTQALPSNRLAPAGLWVFGESSVSRIVLDDLRPETVEQVHRLFPEAEVFSIEFPWGAIDFEILPDPSPPQLTLYRPHLYDWP